MSSVNRIRLKYTCMAIDASGSQAIQRKIYTQEDFDNDFESPIKPAFNYVPSNDPFEGFKKKAGIFCNSLCFLYMNKQINKNKAKQRKVSHQ